MDKRIIEKLNELGYNATEEDFAPSKIKPEVIAEEAYLKAEYNSILIEMLMEE